jgi:hypothetical protein
MLRYAAESLPYAFLTPLLTEGLSNIDSTVRLSSMLIDDFLPAYDVTEYHELEIHAPLEKVYEAVLNLNLSGSKIVRLLLALRGMPALLRKSDEAAEEPCFNLQGLLQSGFVPLGKAPQKELLLGLVGKFWKPTGNILKINPEDFQAFNKQGFAKAVWNFAIDEQAPDKIRLSTETRVFCLDRWSRRRFHFYWFFIRPFSGLIRMEMLRAIRRQAES